MERKFNRIVILDYPSRRTLEIVLTEIDFDELNNYPDLEQYVSTVLCNRYGLRFQDIYWMSTDKPVEIFC